MKKTQVVKTQDGQEVKNDDLIWFVTDADYPFPASLRIGYHDHKYKIFKSKTMAQREIDKWKVRPI